MARSQACATVWSAAGHPTTAGRWRTHPVVAVARGRSVPTSEVRVADRSSSRPSAEEADA
jgi:hypothetical protein